MSYAAQSSAIDPNLIGIKIGTNTLSGWQDARISRGIERCPSSFQLRLTERYPTQPTQISIAPGDPCQITLGSDTVITGYVDRYSASIGGNTHDVSVSGRSKVQDLVDCSARLPNMASNSTTMAKLAQQLAQPFGITVSAPDGDSAIIPAFNVTLTETPWEILDELGGWANKLFYDDMGGNVVIANLGDTHMSSGFVEGQNVQAASVSFSSDNRYTEIDPVYLSTTFLLDNSVPAVGSNEPVIPFIPNSAAKDSSFPAMASGQPRYRPLIVVSPQTQNTPTLAQQYAAWMMARKVGRSQSVTITCDSWRDSSGKLWQPNALAPINIPSLKLVNQTWLIADVTYMRGDQGTTAEVTLMPPSAFAPQKQVLVPFDWQVGTTSNTGATQSR